MTSDGPSETSSYAVRRQLTAMQRGARKSLGQNFLNNPNIAQRIVDLAQITGDEAVVEIGPGLGALSQILAQRAGELWLIELDKDLAEQLRQRFAENRRVHLIEADALRVDFGALLGQRRARAVANLPYNVATPVLMRLLESGRFDRLVLMVQLEVARRLQAKPGSKEYGALSIFTQIAANATIALKVGPGSFVPRPKVDSAVVVLEPHRQCPVELADRALFDRLVRAMFNQRRKQLLNSIKPVTEASAAVLAAAGIDATRRAETLSLSELAALTNAIARQGC